MSTEIKTCFNGCSFTYGEGFDPSDRAIHVYDRILANKYNWSSTNIAVPGSDNHNIFLRSAESIQSQKYDIVFTQWSALNRIWLSPGPDVYYFINDIRHSDYTYRDLYINPSDKKKLNELLLLLNHDYQNIIDLTGYCNILEQLAQANGTRIVFINGLIPWQEDLIQPIGSNFEKSLSSYSKSILDFNTRSDNEIIEYFLKLQQKTSTLNKNIWVNMFDSFYSNTCDHSPAGHHPGIKSHKWMADKIACYIDRS